MFIPSVFRAPSAAVRVPGSRGPGGLELEPGLGSETLRVNRAPPHAGPSGSPALSESLPSLSGLPRKPRARAGAEPVPDVLSPPCLTGSVGDPFGKHQVETELVCTTASRPMLFSSPFLSRAENPLHEARCDHPVCNGAIIHRTSEQLEAAGEGPRGSWARLTGLSDRGESGSLQ